MKVRFTSLMLTLLFLLIASGPAAAQDFQRSPSFVDKVKVTDEAVTFQTKEGNYAAFTLTVAGPEDFLLQQSFAGQDTPVLSIMPEEGMTLPDGSYTLEMTARPEITDKQRAALNQAREKGDRYQIGQLMKEIGLDGTAMVHSINLSVAEGKFINPQGEEVLPKASDTNVGSLEGAPSQGETKSFDSVTLTGQRWEAAYLPTTPTGADAQQAMLVSSNNAAPFAQAAQAPVWFEATFSNTADDGTPMTYHGYLRPIAFDGQGKLFQAYYRSAQSPADATWFRGYFLSENGNIRFLTQAQVTGQAQAAPLFNYVSQDDPTGESQPEAAMPDQVFFDDVIAVGSICAGLDCSNGESFGFDTIRLKENNLRIKAQDTSTSASFPTRDWQITFNESDNGGKNKFSVDDIDGGRTPFTIEAAAPSNSLYVEDGGRIGFGTSTPTVNLHVKEGNTPTLRLEQDGSDGFQAQTWDVAGNEANFFIRDATNGSTLPFKIFPSAPSNALTIEGSTGDIGIGTTTPTADLNVNMDGDNSVAGLLVAGNDNSKVEVRIEDTAPQIQINETDAGATFTLISNGGNFQFRKTDNASALTINQTSGNVTVPEDLSVTGTLTKGGGAFKIDHPLDPANKFLYHSFVESPDMMNVYNGNVTLGVNGEAVVQLPDYFEALNREFRYQLTPIGAPGPNLYIAREIADNQFVVAGGAPGTTVSWQVTGVRKDVYAEENRIPNVVDKPAAVKGFYLHPTLYGQPIERGIGYEQPEEVNQQSGGGQ